MGCESGFQVQAATTHRSDFPGSWGRGDHWEIPRSSCERGPGSGDEGEGFPLFVTNPRLALSSREEEGSVGRLPLRCLISMQGPLCREGPCWLCAFKVMAKAALQRSKEGCWPGSLGPRCRRRSDRKPGLPVPPGTYVSRHCTLARGRETEGLNSFQKLPMPLLAPAPVLGPQELPARWAD